MKKTRKHFEELGLNYDDFEYLVDAVIEGVFSGEIKNTRLGMYIRLCKRLCCIVKWNKTSKFKVKATSSVLCTGLVSGIYERHLVGVDEQLYLSMTEHCTHNSESIRGFLTLPAIANFVKKHNKQFGIREKFGFNMLVSHQLKRITTNFVRQNYPKAAIQWASFSGKGNYIVVRYPNDSMYIGEGATKHEAWKDARDYILGH